MNVIRASPFGSVDAFKTYHGAYGQDSWRVNERLTVNAGLRWDWFSREQERQGEQSNMVPGPPSQYLIPAEHRDIPLSASFVSNLAKDGIELVYTDQYGSGLGKMPKTNFAPRARRRVQDRAKSTSCAPGMACTMVHSRTAAATRASGTTTPSSSRCSTSRRTPTSAEPTA